MNGNGRGVDAIRAKPRLLDPVRLQSAEGDEHMNENVQIECE